VSSIFTIAEIGQAHDGSLGILHSYIDAVATTGVDAIKFQTHIAEAESSKDEPFRVKFSYVDNTRFEYWKRMEFSLKQWKEIKSHCEDVGLEFMSSPFSNKAVDLLESVGVKRYKIGSGEVNHFMLLEKVATTGKDIIISSGMSTYDELDQTVAFLQSFGNQLSILQCTTAYPTTPDQWGLNVITALQARYRIPIGFSDHSGDLYACLAAATMGASILEFHVVFDKQMFGPDSKASLTIDQADKMVKGAKQIAKALSNPVNKVVTSELEPLKKIFEKSLSVNKDLTKGQIITKDDLEARKPAGKGLTASSYRSVVGKRLLVDKTKWEFLNAEDLSDE